MSELRELLLEEIEPDPRNPRLIFPPEELDRLKESIDVVGVLVPIAVYQRNDGRYQLVDGERRFRCARDLGLLSIPAHISEEPDEERRLLTMFNIHMVREPWRDMPTAKALGGFIANTGIEDNKTLSDKLGINVESIKRLKHALDLPKEYQGYIESDRVPLNFFWELKKNVIDKLAKLRPELAGKLSAEEIRTAFVEKKLTSVISDTVALRKVGEIINLAAQDAEQSEDEHSPLDDTLINLVRRRDLTIEDAFEDSVMIMVEVSKLRKRTEGLVRGIERLLIRATGSERDEIINVVSWLREKLGQFDG